MLITKDKVFNALKDFPSFEDNTYYLHVTCDGDIVMSSREADATFTHEIVNERTYFHDGRYDPLLREYERLADIAIDAYNSYEEALDSGESSDELWEKAMEAEAAAGEALQELNECYSCDDYFDKETKDDADFMAIVEDLTEQANGYLASLNYENKRRENVTYYFPDAEYEDEIFGNDSACCFDLLEVIRLSQGWECNLLEEMHEATQDEIKEHGVFNTDIHAGYHSYYQYRSVILSDENDRLYRYYL